LAQHTAHAPISTKKVDRSLLQGKSIDLFRSAIRNPRTRDPYERRLLSFLKEIKMDPNSFVKLAKSNPKKVEGILFNYINGQVERSERGEISPNTIRNPIKAFRLLLEMNDVTSINWKKIKRIVPRGRNYSIDRIPTTEEIKDIYEAGDIRGKALTLTLLTSGIREGAIQSLTVSDWSPIYRDKKLIAGKLVVYNGEPERYITFITPECYHAIEKYLQFRQENGEELNRSSPLFRDKFDPINGYTNTNVEPMTAPAVRQYYNRLLHSIGIRKEIKRRHEFSVHGFRKWYKKRCELGGMKPINVEILLSHSTGISDSYYRPIENELLEDYLCVIGQLGINEAVILRRENEEEIQLLRRQIEIIRTDQEQVRKLLSSDAFKKKLLEKG
jgi:integrase